MSTNITTHQNYIKSPVFTSIQSNWRTPYPSHHSTKSQMIYVYLKLLPTAKLELFITGILKQPSELSYYYIVVVQGKETEKLFKHA